MTHENTCSECERPCEYDACEECCGHSDKDEHCCLICGKDMGEWYVARAEWYADIAKERD